MICPELLGRGGLSFFDRRELFAEIPFLLNIADGGQEESPVHCRGEYDDQVEQDKETNRLQLQLQQAKGRRRTVTRNTKGLTKPRPCVPNTHRRAPLANSS